MKRVLIMLLCLALCLPTAACGARSEPQTTELPEIAPAVAFPPAFLTQQAAEVSEEELSECPELAVTGAGVWRCTHGEMICHDGVLGADTARLPLTALLAEGETAERASIADWGDDSVLLCLTAAGERRTELIELALDGGEIAVRARREVGGELDLLFGAGADWLEIDMVSNAKRLFFSALDEAFMMHFYLYSPEEGTLRALGQRDLSEYLAAAPWGEEAMLLIGPNLRDESVLELKRLSLADGSVELTDSIVLDSALQLHNFAFDSAENRLYYTLNNVVYALTPGGAPTAVGRLDGVTAMFRLGALSGGRYVCHGVKGELLSCAADGTLETVSLRVLDTQGSGLLTEAARDFGLLYPEYSISVREGADEAALGSGTEEYDAFVLSLDSAAWREVCRAGYAAALDGSELLAAVAAAMPPHMRAALERDGHLLALPITVDSMSLTLNVPAAEALTGLGRDALPTDWRGFLELLGRLAREGTLLDRETVTLYSGATVGQLRELLLGWILQDYLLWAGVDAGNRDTLEKGLLPILKAYNEVDWTRLGLAEDAWYDMGGDSIQGLGPSGGIEAVVIAPGMEDVPRLPGAEDGADAWPDFRGTGDGCALLSDSFVEIAVLDLEDGVEIWPLSVLPGGRRLIPQTMTLLCVNPRSAHPEGALAYAEYLWRKMDMPAKMTLCSSLNEPVRNEFYEDDLAWFERQAADLERVIAREDKPAEKKLLEAQYKELRAYAERYRKNAYWAASAQSIALYRGLEESLTPTGAALWEDSALDMAMLDFLDGLLTPKQYIRRLGELLS